MFNYIAIFALIMLILFLALLFYISIVIEKKKTKKYFENEKKRIAILNDLISLQEKVDRKVQNNLIKKESFQEVYLSQAEYIIKNYGYQLEKIEIVPIASSKNGKTASKSNLTKQKMRDSLLKSPKHIREDILELSEMLDSIYKFNHPVKYRFVKFKKNTILRILLFFLNLALAVLEFFENRVKKTKKREIISAEKKIRATKASNSFVVESEPILVGAVI